MVGLKGSADQEGSCKTTVLAKSLAFLDNNCFRWDGNGSQLDNYTQILDVSQEVSPLDRPVAEHLAEFTVIIVSEADINARIVQILGPIMYGHFWNSNVSWKIGRAHV